MRAKFATILEAVHSEPRIAVLLQAYYEAVVRQQEESEYLGWHTTVDGVRASLDTNGVFTIRQWDTNDIGAKTAFLPGFGTVEATVASRNSPADPHARTGTKSWMRGDGRVRSRESSQHDIKSRLEQRRSQNWTTNERIYYLVFRCVAQTIRSWQGDHPSGVGLASLKQILPRMSHLKYPFWLALRNSTGVCHE